MCISILVVTSLVCILILYRESLLSSKGDMVSSLFKQFKLKGLSEVWKRLVHISSQSSCINTSYDHHALVLYPVMSIGVGILTKLFSVMLLPLQYTCNIYVNVWVQCVTEMMMDSLKS